MVSASIGRKIDSDTSYINRVETNKLNPSITVLTKIADVLEQTLDQLVKNSENEPEVRIRDKSLSERMRLVDSLDEDDRNVLIYMIDTMLTKQRMKELVIGKESV